MIEADKRKAIYLLDQEGMSAREISRRLGISRNTIGVIHGQNGEMPVLERKKQQIDEDLLRRLYDECDGYAQRVHEKLTEEEGVHVTYPTLTRMLRSAGISKPALTRCDRMPDKPGAEMQHDTTVYRVMLGDKKVKLIASILYLRYSKRRYLKFYRVFNRFKMKCCLHEALMFWGYAAGKCIIDNTNLARLRGTGAAAVIVPELKAFAKLGLGPGESEIARFSLDQRALAYWDPAESAWIAEPGEFELLVGSSSRDIRARAGLVLEP